MALTIYTITYPVSNNKREIIIDFSITSKKDVVLLDHILAAEIQCQCVSTRIDHDKYPLGTLIRFTLTIIDMGNGTSNVSYTFAYPKKKLG